MILDATKTPCTIEIGGEYSAVIDGEVIQVRIVARSHHGAGLWICEDLVNSRHLLAPLISLVRTASSRIGA